ncbi:MAG: hypothetical protein JO113_05275 [Candidatus Eremiobacteraeota bacterium]|nr:hypothetical protein [Candidatus Eremiobacteraeota bacterium]
MFARTSLRISAASIGIALACALCACSGSASHGSYGSGDPSLAAANPGGGAIDPFLSDGHAVLQALDAIAQHSGRPMRVTSISADRVNGLMVDVQEPAHRINVDHYVVAPDGSLSGPTPVKLMSLDSGPITAAKVDAQAFDPKAIAFANLTQTVREAIAKSGYPDARVTEWEIAGIGPDDRRFIYFESARARPSAEITPQLKIVRMGF